MIRALTRRLLFRGGAAAVGGSVVTVPSSTTATPARTPRTDYAWSEAGFSPDTELVSIRAQVNALEARFRALPMGHDGAPEDAAASAFVAEVNGLIVKACGIPATTPQGLAAKGWMAMAYCETSEGDRVLRSLCWDLQAAAGLVVS